MLPLRWKLGKRLMLHRFPCSTVIFFVCIFLILTVSLPLCVRPEPPREVYLRISGASFKGVKYKVSKMILPRISKISPEHSLTLDMRPDAKLRVNKPIKRFWNGLCPHPYINVNRAHLFAHKTDFRMNEYIRDSGKCAYKSPAWVGKPCVCRGKQ